MLETCLSATEAYLVQNYETSFWQRITGLISILDMSHFGKPAQRSYKYSSNGNTKKIVQPLT